MKKFLFFFSLILLYSCTETKSKIEDNSASSIKKEIVVPAFQTILDSADVQGSILIFDWKKDVFYSNDFQWELNGNLPASTYKITNSIIALESGVVENDSSLFKWNGEKRALKIWEQDLIFKEAFHYSCVPCYQKVAREIGVKRMNQYLTKLNYGKMIVDSSSIDKFWLEGESKINQYEQIDFLKRFYVKELPISKKTHEIMRKMMIIEEGDYILSGKTGWSIRNGNNNGWFVGYLEKGDQLYFFATNIKPNTDFDMSFFPKIRKEITMAAFKEFIGE